MSEHVDIGNRRVGVGEPVYIIAEIGSNHDRDLSQAMRLIDVAADAGADAAKFQLYAATDLYAPDSPVFDLVKATELPVNWVPQLAKHASDRGMAFMASPFSTAAVDTLAAVDSPAYKVASSDVVNFPLLKHIAAQRKPVVLSSGMSNLADIETAIELIRSEGNDDIVLLHCTALYPTLPEQVNLRAMDTLRAAFGVPVGHSDHTLDTVIPIAAAARGANVIEKHLTPNRSNPGPDHSYALEPAEFARMVREIRTVEAALGSPVKRMLPEEAVQARRASVRAARDLRAGDQITADAVIAERRAGGLQAYFLCAIIGGRVKTAIKKGDPVAWANVAL
jgi:N,N'-diacetyllegionaminate synthase